MKREKMIRILHLLAIPCWGTYNVVAGAYGSAIGNLLALVSILTALRRYKHKKEA